MDFKVCPYKQALKSQQLGKASRSEVSEKAESSVGNKSTVPLDLVTSVVREFDENPAAALKELHKKFGPTFEVETEQGRFRFDTDADTARKALVLSAGDNASFMKSEQQSHGLSRVLGKDNLLLNSGDDWQSSRSALKDFFSARNLKTDGHVSSISEVLDRHLSKVEDQLDDQGKADVDLNALFRKATLDVALTHLFSTNPTDQDLDSLTQAYGVVTERVGKELILPAAVTGLKEPEEEFQSAVGTIKAWAKELVSDRLENPAQKADALSALMEATDPKTGAAYSQERLESEVLNLMLAGHETTANLITWTLTNLARSPIEQNELVSEVQSLFGDRVPTSKELRKSSGIDKIWRKEALEHPPNFLLAREASADTVLDSDENTVEVEKGTTLLMSTEHLNEQGSTMFSFGMGQRFCLGVTLATMETELAVTRFLQKFEVSDTGERGRHSGLTQIPKDTLVSVRKRS